MAERHSDNDLIDEMSKAPGQKGSAGGDLAQAVGKRAEEKSATEDIEVERVTGADKPQANAQKGRKTTSRMLGGG
ncbi:MAG TPA: hypothetical protein VJQ77_06720 [Novosphingobium sp.]|nr:hypothetical protein [Novosphingobium sp.]